MVNVDEVDKVIDGINLMEFVEIVERMNANGERLGESIGLDDLGIDVRGAGDSGAAKYMRAKVLGLSEKTQARVRGDLKGTLADGILNRESVHQLVGRMGKVFEGLKDWEAERVVRTEVMDATNQGRLEAYRGSGVVGWKMWFNPNINGKRTADDSKRMHGQIRRLDESFIDPLDGKSYSAPPMRPHDRCTIIPVTKLPKKFIMISGAMYDLSYVTTMAKRFK